MGGETPYVLIHMEILSLLIKMEHPYPCVDHKTVVVLGNSPIEHKLGSSTFEELTVSFANDNKPAMSPILKFTSKQPRSIYYGIQGMVRASLTVHVNKKITGAN